MKINRLLLAKITICAVVIFPSVAEAWGPGTYPAAPLRMDSYGLTVNNQDRNDVVAFWHAVYQASEGYGSRINWTGDYSGNNGTISNEFAEDVERRLNYFRAMCGVNSTAQVNVGDTVAIDYADPFVPPSSTLKSTAAQDAALMLSRNYNPNTGLNPALSHNPPDNLIGWSASAWNGTAKGNLAFGLYGPGAISEYMIERLASNMATSTWNSLVGHRRWILYPGATAFATGDQPGTDTYNPPSNVLYVIQKPKELVNQPSKGFVAYPAAGFFPANINSPYWSLSLAGADFSSATVRMTDSSGVSVPVKSTSRDSSYGDPAIVWAVGDAVAVQSVFNDTTFNVTVSGIAGAGVPSSYSYSVTLINPDRLTSDQSIAGPATTAARQPATFTFTPPAGNEAIQVGTFLRNTAVWRENAEVAGAAMVIDGPGKNYPLVVQPSSFPGFGNVSGLSSFRLTFSTAYDALTRGIPDQWFELDRDIIPSSKGKVKPSISFKFRRGYMTTTTSLVLEMSSNGGVTWTVLGDPIKGASNTKYDQRVTLVSRSLPRSGIPIRLRFRYFTGDGPIYTQENFPTLPTGIFIDEIMTKGCIWRELKVVNTLPSSATTFVLNSSTAGAPLVKGTEWDLMLRTQLGGKWFPYGPAKSVAVTAP